MLLIAAGCATPDTPPTAGAASESAALSAALAEPSVSSVVTPGRPPAAVPDPVQQAFADLESRSGARVGLYAVDIRDGREIAHRADERFGYASTHKALSAAVMLDENSIEDLDEVVRFSQADLVTYSPVTEARVETGMTLREIGDAAVRFSDNTAANLIFEEIGGPAAFDDALEGIGDTVTVAERTETALNDTTPGDPRDTSTPRALAQALRHFAVDQGLTTDKRAVLTDWLRRNTTGDALVRAAVPTGWVVGDKTGTGAYGTRNDIAVIWPPGRDPIVIAVLTDHAAEDAEPDDLVVAEAARIAVQALQ
jgi:beta-lactamase class A